MRVLIDHGADPNRSTLPGAPTDGFMRDCRTRGETPLHRAAAFGSVASIRMLLDAGARIDAPDAHGDSPLSWASWHLRPDPILAMLCFGGHRIHPARVEAWRAHLGIGAGQGMEAHLQGEPHRLTMEP
jgi:hypothetical protein